MSLGTFSIECNNCGFKNEFDIILQYSQRIERKGYCICSQCNNKIYYSIIAYYFPCFYIIEKFECNNGKMLFSEEDILLDEGPTTTSTTFLGPDEEENMIYSSFDNLGKINIKSTRTDFTETTGVDGMKDIIRKVLIGGNVRDITEFITQKRLIVSYAAMLDLFVNELQDKTDNVQGYSDFVSRDLANARGEEQTLDLWLLGLTKKGLDNIVRDETNLSNYKDSFAVSISETISCIQDKFGPLSGNIILNGKGMRLNWNAFSLLCIALGSQTLSIRGSAKSMNGKLFEKLILGSLLTIIGFKYCESPPSHINKLDKLFWLSNMDENERETDATLIFNGKAISIDIGFIGKGNPEISLDKVTRFNRYKQIAGMGHEMKTIIIVDTVAENSDLFNKANRVDGIVLQMSRNDWIIAFAKAVCDIFSFDHPLCNLQIQELDAYLRSELALVNINKFII